MKQKKEHTPTFKEIWKLNNHSLLLLNQRCPGLFISLLLATIIKGMILYVELYLSAQILNALTQGALPETVYRLVIYLIGISAVLTLLQAFLTNWKNRRMAVCQFQIHKLYADKMLDLSYEQLSQQRTHDLRTQIYQNEQWSGWGIQELIKYFETSINAVTQIISAFILILGLFLHEIPQTANKLQWLNQPGFALGILIIMIIATFLAPICRNKANDYWAINDDESKQGNRFFGFWGAMAYDRNRALDIRMYNQQDLCDYYAKQDRSFLPGSKIAQAAKGPMGGFNALAEAIFVLFYGITYTYVGVKAWTGAFQAGSTLQYISAIVLLSKGVSSLVEILGEMRTNTTFLRTTFEFLNISATADNQTASRKPDREVFELEFRDVSYKYPKSSSYALRHVSVKIHTGERIAIVGENGSGKTTFVKLLCRMCEPTEGVILLNGQNISEYPYEEYIQLVSAIFQDFQLLALPIGENIAGNRTYDENKVQACLKQVSLIQRVSQMKDGLNSFLYKELDKDGVSVSGGEAQKIAIARALYKDAPILILDEPTAALDPRAEADLYAQFLEMVQNKTSLFISHRLSSCKFCERILVFDSGQIVECGSHNNLVSKPQGKYYALWQAQAQYYETYI